MDGVSEFFFQILENVWTPAALPGAWKMIFNCRSCDSAAPLKTSNLLKLWKDGCFFSGKGMLCWQCKAIMVSLTLNRLGFVLKACGQVPPLRVKNSSLALRGGTSPTHKQHSTKTEAVCSEGV